MFTEFVLPWTIDFVLWSAAWEIAQSSVELTGAGNQCGLQNKLKMSVA